MKYMIGTTRGRFYLLLITLSLITLAITTTMRHQVEKNNNGVAIVLNYEQMEELSVQSEEDLQWWLNELSDAGATALSINEELLIDYLKQNFVSFYVTGGLKNNQEVLETLEDEVVNEVLSRDDFDLVITTDSHEDYERIKRGLTRYDSLDVSMMNETTFIVDGIEEDLLYEISGDLTNADGIERYYYTDIVGTKVLQLPIGFNESVIAEGAAAGLQLLLRPANHSDYSDEMLDNYIDEINKYDNVMPLMLSYGKEELGYNGSNTDYVDDLYALVEDYGFAVALTESTVQRQYGDKDGLNQLVAGFESPEFVRVFSMWPYIQERYIYTGYRHGEEVGNAMYRAITERNIRVILFNPFKWNESDYVTIVEDYHSVFQSLEERIGVHGYAFGDFTVLDDLVIPTGLRVLLYIEILMFGLVLLNEGIYRMNKYMNGGLAIMVVLAGAGLHFLVPNVSVKLFAFLASVIFASLAGVVYYKGYLANPRVKGNFANGIIGLMVSGATALMGGLYIGSVMAYTMYFLEVELFTGVKLSLLAPIAVVVVFAAIMYVKEKATVANQKLLAEVKEESLMLLRQPIQVKHVVIMVIALGFGYLYLARSGHESGVDPMSLEILMRNYLENLLPARPRNKEFLIAFPLIIIGLCYKKYFNQWAMELKYMMRLLFLGVGAIGFTSITNTFSHIRTPIMTSFVRTLISMGFGVLVGLAMYMAIQLAIWILAKLIELVKVKLMLEA